MKYIYLFLACFLMISCQRYDELSSNEDKFYIKQTEHTWEVVEAIRQAGFKVKDVRPSNICKDCVYVIVFPEEDNTKLKKLKILNNDLENKKKMSDAN